MPEGDLPQYPWYTLASGSQLEQGDILLQCPVFLIPPAAADKPGEYAVTIERHNVIVMTQSCDLAVRADGTCNVDDVILAALYFRSELRQDSTFGTSHNWENARKGRYPAYHVLNRCDLTDHGLDYMLVDLRRIFTLSVAMVREFASRHRRHRVRLLPPYREHLSQAFARFFMRVGLPVDIPRFK
jgi:hypothetical protein